MVKYYHLTEKNETFLEALVHVLGLVQRGKKKQSRKTREPGRKAPVLNTNYNLEGIDLKLFTHSFVIRTLYVC